MKPTTILFLSGVLLALPSAFGAESAPTPAGHWVGSVQMNERDIPLAVDLARNERGAWIGSISATGTTAVDVPIVKISVDALSMHFTAGLAGNPTFDGTLSPDGSTFSGSAANAQGEAPFQFKRAGEANVKLPSASSALPSDFPREWTGSIEVGGKNLRLVLRLAPAADGTATAVLISVDQRNQPIPVSTVTIRERTFEFESRAVSGSFRGTRSENGEIAGDWTHGGNQVPLILKPAASAEQPVAEPRKKTSAVRRAPPAQLGRTSHPLPLVLLRGLLPLGPLLNVASVWIR